MVAKSCFYSFERSLWRATAGGAPSGMDLQCEQQFDVVVIGGGIAGSVAAMSLVEQGCRVALLEANELGSGATGRCGGHITPTFTSARPGDLIEKLGSRGEALVNAVAKSADNIFDLVDKYQIDCDSGQNGWFQPAKSIKSLEQLEQDSVVWNAFGVKSSMLDAQKTQTCTGVSGYAGAWVSETGGTLHPVKFVQGLVFAALTKGLSYFANTSVNAYSRVNGKWELVTNKGKLFAEKILICTNAQSAQLTPKLYKSIIPMTICHVATKPIPESQRARLLKLGQGMSDTQANLFSYRFDSQFRLISGGLPVLNLGGGCHLAKQIVRRLSSELELDSYPDLEFTWLGRASITPDLLPRVYDIGPGAYAVTACNGRGLALSTLWAIRTANAMMSETFDDPILEVVNPEPLKGRWPAMLGTRLYPIFARIKDRFQY